MFFHGGCKSSFVQLTCPKKDILSSAGGGISLLHQRAALLTQDGIERGGGGWGGAIQGSGGVEKEARARAVPGNGNGNLRDM